MTKVIRILAKILAYPLVFIMTLLTILLLVSFEIINKIPFIGPDTVGEIDKLLEKHLNPKSDEPRV